MVKPTELVTQTRELFVTTFPMCFRAKGTLKQPLEIGIRADLYARLPDIPADLIRKALRDYCDGGSYQVALLTVGAPRRDLDGDVCGTVTKNQAEMAKARLRTRPPVSFQRWLDEAGIEFEDGLEMKHPAVAAAATGCSGGTC